MGRRRDAVTWAADDNAIPPADLGWLRGFTGHEHLDAFALINMNARLYDPKLGRMLSVDNFVSVPSSAMGYNRYTYANNNPLSYIDPSGNFLLEAIAIGALISAVSYTAQAAISPGGLQQNFTFKGYLTSVAIGAAAGGVSFGIGNAFNVSGTVGSAFLREGSRMFAHGLLGAGMSGIQGGDMLSGFAAGFVSSAAGYAGGSAMRGMSGAGRRIGGTLLSAGVGAASSAMTGGDPWMGAAIGAIGHLTNQAMHKAANQRMMMHYRNGKPFDYANLAAHGVLGAGTDFTMDRKSFRDFVRTMKENGRISDKRNYLNPDSKVGLWYVDVNTYGTKYAMLAGSATLWGYENRLVGYSDRWDFEPHSPPRAGTAELQTTIGRGLGFNTFTVFYGLTPERQYLPY